MDESIRVSAAFYEWLASRNREGETMEDTLRRLLAEQHPEDFAGLLTPEEAETLADAVKGSRAGDEARKRRARDAFSKDE